MMDKINISNFINNDYREYALYTISSRGIPNVNDFLTPGQRLILLHSPSSFNKTLSVVGDVMKSNLYHHGDCLSYETMVNLGDGSQISIGEWAEEYPDVVLLVKCVDDDGKPTISLGHSPRVGHITTEVYKIQLDDESGTIIECTGNHPFKLKDGSWKMAKDLTEDDDLLDF